MAGLGLANFREQYPQYSHIEDEDLARLVKQRYYPDMPEPEYRDAMGLPPPPEPPPEPTLWDRVTGLFESDQNKPDKVLQEVPDLKEDFGTEDFDTQAQAAESKQTAPAYESSLSDQFFAGWDEYQANRATAQAFSAIGEYPRVEDQERGIRDRRAAAGGVLGVSGKMVSNFARNMRAQAGDAEAEAQIQRDIADRQENLTEILQKAINRRRELMERTQHVPYSQATQEMVSAKGFGETVKELADDPIRIIAEVSVRSLPSMADALPLSIVGGIAAGPYGFASGMGAGAAMTEYRASFADSLQEQGVSLVDAKQMLAAAQNPEIMRQAHEYALKRSSIIGTASMLSGGIAGKSLTPFVKNALARELSNVAAQTVIQAGIEAGGEAGAQLATTGEISAGEVMAEAIGGGITAPIEVGSAAITGVRAQHAINEAARVESEVNDFVGRDYVPRETESPEEAIPEGQPTGQAVQQEDYQQARNRVATLEEEFADLPTDQKANPRNAVNEQLTRARERVKRIESTSRRGSAIERAPEYSDERLRTRPMRRALFEAAQEIDPATTAGRRAHKAVNRAITGQPLTEAETRVVGTLLDTIQESETPAVMGMMENRRTDPRRQGQPDRRSEVRPGKPDRRQADRAARVQSMSLDDLIDEIYTDSMTGIANRRAWDEDAGQHAWVAEVDVDSLKWVNDHISEDAGDAMLAAVAEAMDQADVEAYRIGGDEFVIGGETQEAVEAAAELAKSILNNQKINDPKGTVDGISITYGIGQSKEAASAILKSHKQRREAQGKRSPRGVAPPGATLSVTRPLDMEPGTNYVPMIGNTGSLPIDQNNNLILGNGRRVRIPKKPVRREHILALLQRAFGRRIYQGRVRGKLRLGFYRPGQGEIRIKNANDIEVAAHEVAHWLDDRFPWISALYKQYADEMKSVSYDATKIYEGWAEFMRLFMTQEYEIIKRTPAFYDAFRKALSKHKQIESVIYDLQELMHAWTQQGARARLASKHGVTAADFFERVRILFRTPLIQSALDGLRRIREVEIDVIGSDKAYRKLRLALGGSNGVLEAAMFYGTPGWRADGRGLEFTGESLLDIFGNHWGSDELALYMMARRGQELLDQGRENLMRVDEIATGLSLATEENGFAEMFDRFQKFNQRMLDFAEGSGILEATTRDMIEEMNQNYVPFHRVIESEIDGRSVRRGGNPFQRLKGGTQNVANIWENIINNNGHIIRMSMVNDGKRALFQVLGRSGPLHGTQLNQEAGKYAAPISSRIGPVGIASDQVIRKVVESLGIEWADYRQAAEGMLSSDPEQAALELFVVQTVERMKEGIDEFVTFFQTGLDPTGNVDFYLDNGKKRWFEIGDAALMDSLQFLGPKGTNLVLGVLGGFSGALRRGVVAVPVFQLKNFFRDSVNSWLLSDHVKVPAARAMGIVFSRLQKDPLYQLMMLNGGGFANRAQGLQAQRKMIIDPTRLAAIYDRFMGRFENANRLAEFKAAIKAGEGPAQAALLSREISTDFAMRGSAEIARFLAIAVPFLNARVQGLYRVGRQFTRSQAALSYAIRGTSLALATLALYALNKEDDRYKEMPEDIKDLYWVFFTGQGEDDYFLIPKPFESGMLWGTLPERMYELTEKRDGKEFADALGWMFLQTFNMDMTPQIFQPELELEKNKAFTGAPIIPNYLKNVEPSQQFTYYTSKTAREAGQMFGISPIKLEHRIRGYLGTLGTYALGASDAMINAATDSDELAFGEDPTRGETWKENILTRSLIDPLVNEGPPRRTKYVTDFYDMLKNTQMVANTADLMIRRQNQEVENYVNDPEKQSEIAVNDVLVEAKNTMNKIRENMDLVRMDKNMDGDEKRIALWELTRQRNQIAREAITEIKAAQAAIEEQANAQ